MEINQKAKIIMDLSSFITHLLKKINYPLSQHGISFTELSIMHHLYMAPNKTMKRIMLAELSGLSASGITRLLNPMEKIHLVEKEQNARDARESLVKLSEAGLQIYQEAMNSFQQSAEFHLKNLNDDDIKLLAKLSAGL